MPNSKSASKRLRNSVKSRLRNRIRKSEMKTGEKTLMEKIDGADLAAAKLALNECFSLFDKAAKDGIVHKNLVSRKKASLSAKMAQAEAE